MNTRQLLQLDLLQTGESNSALLGLEPNLTIFLPFSRPIPASAAAPGSSPAVRPPPAPAFLQSGFLIGRISCVPSDGTPPTYISRYLDASSGFLLRTQDPTHSLHVRWSPSSLPTTFGTVVSSANYPNHLPWFIKIF